MWEHMYVCVSTCVCVCMCDMCGFLHVGQEHHSTHVEVREQLVELDLSSHL